MRLLYAAALSLLISACGQTRNVSLGMLTEKERDDSDDQDEDAGTRDAGEHEDEDEDEEHEDAIEDDLEIEDRSLGGDPD